MNNIIITADLEKRFWAKVTLGSSDKCWAWTAYRNAKGYGIIGVSGSARMAHRVVLAIHGMQVPAGMQVDHLCRNRGCVNPNHLEIVTSRENTLRGYASAAINARKRKCVRGHVFTLENTLHESGRRRCAECRESLSERRAARMVERAEIGDTCSLENCTGVRYARGYCQPHYRRNRAQTVSAERSLL